MCALVALPEQAVLHAQLSQVQSEARDLLALQQWDAQARRSAAVAGLLAELADCGPKCSPMTLMQQWSEVRPDLAFLALPARRLTVPARPAAPAVVTADAAPADRIANAGPDAAVPAPPPAPSVKTEAPERRADRRLARRKRRTRSGPKRPPGTRGIICTWPLGGDRSCPAD